MGDGNTLYSAFNITAFLSVNPPPKANSSTLLIGNGHNMSINLGIRMPESIVAKMVTVPSGDVYALSASGMLYLPIPKLYTYPIIMPETTQVFLSSDPCSRGLVSGTLRVNNIGAGKLTYSLTNTNQSLTTDVSSGLAPSSIKFTMEPGRINVNRQSGTNLTTGLTTLPGHATRHHAEFKRGDQYPEQCARVYERARPRPARHCVSDSDDAEQFARRVLQSEFYGRQ